MTACFHASLHPSFLYFLLPVLRICPSPSIAVRGPHNLSVVTYEADGWPADRPVFSTCDFTVSVEECYFSPDLDLTPRIWAYERWAIAGETLSFQGAGFQYDTATVTLGVSCQCLYFHIGFLVFVVVLQV